MYRIIGESILPLVFYMILQIPVFFTGMSLLSGQEEAAWDGKTAMKTYVTGQLLLWAVLQVLAVVMIQCGLKFNVLFFSFLAVAALLCVLGLRRFLRMESDRRRLSLKNRFASISPLAKVILLAALILIVWQALQYYLCVHIDQDDARWLAEANDALNYGDMLRRNYSTGEYLGYLYFDVYKEVSSPWPMFFAIIAKLLHTDVAIVAHTLYAPIALLMSYLVYWLIGSELFKKAASRAVFLLSISILNLFFAETTHTQSVVTLVRIWQGKATVASIIIPLLMYLAICINKRDETADWFRLMVTCCGACLLSGMGVSISGIMITVYGLYSIIAYRRWKRIPLWLLALVPAVAFSVLHFFYRG